MSGWTPEATARALVEVSGLATGVLIGVGVLIAWYCWCRWGRRTKG